MHQSRGAAGQQTTAHRAQALLQARHPAADILSLRNRLAGEVERRPHGTGAGLVQLHFPHLG